MEVYEDDGPWMWVAFATNCRLIVAFIIGPKKHYVADEFVRLTADCLSELYRFMLQMDLIFIK